MLNCFNCVIFRLQIFAKSFNFLLCFLIQLNLWCKFICFRFELAQLWLEGPDLWIFRVSFSLLIALQRSKLFFKDIILIFYLLHFAVEFDGFLLFLLEMMLHVFVIWLKCLIILLELSETWMLLFFFLQYLLKLLLLGLHFFCLFDLLRLYLVYFFFGLIKLKFKPWFFIHHSIRLLLCLC